MSEAQLAVPLIIAAEAAIVLAVIGISRRGLPGALPFGLLMAAAAWTTLAVMMGLLSDAATLKFLWTRVQQFGEVMVPAAWLAFVLQFRLRRTSLSDRTIALLAVEPVLFLAAVWTNGVHGLVWTSIQTAQQDSVAYLALTHGPLLWAHDAYLMIAIVAGSVALVLTPGGKDPAVRRQGQFVALAGGIMVAREIFTGLNILPFGLDVMPLATLISGAVIAAALFRYKTLSLIPIARDAVMEGMTEGAIILDDEGVVIDMNPAAERIVGVSLQQAYGRDALQLLGPFGMPVSDVQLPFLTETRADTDAAAKHYEFRVTRLYRAETKSRGKLVVIRDITLQKEAESELQRTVKRLEAEFGNQTAALKSELQERRFTEVALRESEERSRQVIDTAYDAFVSTNANGAIIDWNPRAVAMFGWEREEAVGRDFADTLLPARTRGEHRRGLRYYLTSGEWEILDHPVELPVLHREGWEFDAEMTMRPAIVHGTRVFNAFIHDITERKRAEQALLDSNAQLAQALRELESAQKQVVQQERLRALGQMASGIAHEFNNALSPIVGFSELLMTKPNILSDHAKSKRYIEGIRTAAQDAANVVSRLREFYRSRESGYENEAIDLNALINQTVTLTQPKWKSQALARGVSVQLSTDLHGTPVVEGDASALREVLTNLIFNAVDAMPQGGRILIHTGEENGRAYLQVADSGTGMSEDVLKRCMDPFFSTKGEKGSGLGLALVHGIVERHGGNMNINSTVGRGTTFTIDFPIVERKAPQPVEPVAEAIDNRKLSILAVDDDRSVLEVIEAVLQAEGHQVAVVNSAREGLEYLRNGAAVDLVLTDLAMPLMNGDKLAQAIKRMHPGIPVVMMTGFAEMMADSEFSSSVDVVISKPVSLAKLREAFDSVMPAAA